MKMAVRGIYTKAEEQMLAEWRERMDKQVGWLGEKATEQVQYPVFHRTASKDTIINMAYAADYWNPLWRDENYARNTRWGGIIAPPVFMTVIAFGPQDYLLGIPPEVGVKKAKVCHSYEFFKPIQVDDSFRVWCGHAKIVDVTETGENANRRFKYDWEISYINQKDEVTGIFRRADLNMIMPPGTQVVKKDLKYTKDYIYTEEDIEAIDGICEAEEIRGNKIRWWEDVKVGDELKPVALGPIAPWDAIAGFIGWGLAPTPMRQVRKEAPDRFMMDPVTNVPHKGIEFHAVPINSPSGGQFGYSTTQSPFLIEATMARLITNWMGDDGFLRRLEWMKLVNVPVGDTMFARGKVVRKYVDENDDYMVDFSVWLESSRGYMGYVSPATASLLSREKCHTQNRPPMSVIYPAQGRYAPDLSKQGGTSPGDIKAGDKVRIKDRPDWWLPSGYKLAGLGGLVDEVIDETVGQPESYVLVLLDEDVTGIDISIPLGFRMDAVEKI